MEPFRATITVRFGDVDPAGIVYFPRFLNYIHVALEEFFSRVVGIDYPVLIEKHRVAFPTVHIEMDFKRPLRYGDRVGVEVTPTKLGRTSVEWRYDLFRPNQSVAAASARLVTVYTNMDTFEKEEIPGWLREKLTGA